MSLRSRVASMAAVATISLACSSSRRVSSGPSPSTPLIEAALVLVDGDTVDPSIQPCDDFYAYACGRWMVAHPIPADRPRISRYDEMIARNELWTREVLEHAAEANRPRSSLKQQVGDDYASCLDEEAIEQAGLAPLQEELTAIDDALRMSDWAGILARLHAQDIHAPFTLYADSDLRSPDRTRLQIEAAGKGLRDRDDYLRDDPHSRELRSKYHAYLSRIFALLGERQDEAQADASRVVRLETELARATPSAVERREAERQHHPTSIEGLQKLSSSIAWSDYFKHLGVPTAGLVVNVEVPDFLRAVQTLLETSDRQAWRAYLRWHVVHRSTAVLPASFATASFDFFQREARGVKQIAPRWRRCLGVVNEHLGEAVGQLFVRDHFSKESRERARSTIEAVRAAFREELSVNSWMSERTRQDALRKLDSVMIKVGHPEVWRSYSGLVITRTDAYGNDRRARMFEMRRQFSKLARPTDRGEWFTSPHDLDGYSTRRLNEVAFTAGLLQRPFFDPAADRPLQFGALGGVAGHEVIHLFDDQGRKYDWSGAVNNWWTPDDARRYSEMAQCFVSEYAREKTVDDLHINGLLTLNENLADNGGLRLAYRAAHLNDAQPLVDGFTPAQRFFLAWAQIRCENATEAEMRRRTHSDSHSPGRLRVNVVLSNMTEFAAAFHCDSGTRMAPDERCVLW